MEREEYTRITEILKPFSGIEFIPTEYLIPAAERGTKVHDYIEAKLRGFDLPIEDETLESYIKSFDLFWTKWGIPSSQCNIIIEQRFYCDKLQITGKSDCIIETKDRTYIVDWKTSSKVHEKSWSLQGAAYKYLAEVNGIKNIEEVIFIKLDKYGKKATAHKWDNHEENIETFLKCVELYRFFDMNNTRAQRI